MATAVACGASSLFPNWEVCHVSDPPQGEFNAYAIFLLSIITPIFLMLSAFSVFIHIRILSLTTTSLPGQETGQDDRDRRSCAEEKSEKDEMALNSLVYSADLLDSRLEDIQIQPLSPLYQKASQNENHHMLIDGPEDLLGSLVDNLKITALAPKHNPRTLPQRRTLDALPPSTKPKDAPIKPVKWYGEISWSLKGTSVFDDAEQELDAFNNRINMLDHRKPYDELWIFQYGLRYMPSAPDENVYRTIRIDDIPLDKTLNNILPLVVGEIYSARLADTCNITGHNTAMITFISENDAARFVAGAANRTVTLPFGRVVPVHTPTYPMPADIQKSIMHGGYTRILGMFHPRPTLKMEITRAMTSPYQRHALQLESIVDGPGVGEVSIKMLSVKAAAVVFEWLMNHPTLGKCQFRFLKQDGTPSVDPESGNGSEDANW
ncbi:uncharacterized protein DSM5745_08215 [Aspergillus mulundensis]|uniref:Uncharacterized protein n=1 Tax=Aspergillus mulundensis TaxID=1810919 RepID=A0A3D8RA13_9EURO|nr:Uncharacterized protein DSM5745_08215 [Aspergillus mulundensis]RDW70704.1 Uncharacterized protein DSM5745_08215 [Aspergillus mulundensis]